MPRQIKPLTADMSRWSHIQIGSLCKNLYLPNSLDDLAECLGFFGNLKQKIIPLGGGSNLLFGNTNDTVIIGDARLPAYWKKENRYLVVSGNYNITQFLMETSRINRGGLEFLAGIPAHLAGLAKMNAGAWQQQFGDYVTSIALMDWQGNKKVLLPSDIDFDYRHTSIEGFIYEITLKPVDKPEKEILQSIRNYIDQRKQKQPLNIPNLGSVFKNPPGDFAGRLLQQAGYRGKRKGEAAFSEKHANIMVNLGKASFADAWQLISEARQEVLRLFDLELELEIQVVNN